MTIWEKEYNLKGFPAVSKDERADVVIVGGGITGITAAYLLSQQNISVVLVEADRLMHGTTGHTTAKITAQHGLIYDELLNNTGKTNARLHYEGAIEALNMIEKTVQDHNIDCDFKKTDAVLYATSDAYTKKLEKESRAYKALNIPAEEDNELPFTEAKKTLTMKGQAEFHPIKFLSALVHKLEENGVKIFEHTVATTITEEDHPTVITSEGHQLQGSHVLICSHFPFFEGTSFYFSRLYAEQSYIIAVKTKKMIDDQMYLDVEPPIRSIRKAVYKGEDVLLFGGESHKTGQGIAVSEHYKALERFIEEKFGIEEVYERWSAQDLTTLDKLPYIGKMSDAHPNVYVSTGYRKWGMTTGTLAAMMLNDEVQGKKNRYQSLYSPHRFYADPSIPTFLRENVNVAKHLLKGKLEGTKRSLDDLAKGEGTIFRHEGQRKGAYRDEKNELHIVDTTCTHLGCEVNWNDGDHTWDCPCHGSRFSYTGDVIEGPAEKPLEKVNHTMLESINQKDESSGW